MCPQAQLAHMTGELQEHQAVQAERTTTRKQQQQLNGEFQTLDQSKSLSVVVKMSSESLSVVVKMCVHMWRHRHRGLEWAGG